MINLTDQVSLIYYKRVMRFNSLQEVLVAAATSPDSQIRTAAELKLQELRGINTKAHLDEVFILLACLQQDIHTIAYSYILNGWILRINRLNYDITSKIKELYQEMQNTHRVDLLANPVTRFRAQNMIKLSAAYYSKPTHSIFAEAFLRRLATDIMKQEGSEMMLFHIQVLQRMNDVIPRSARSCMGGKCGCLIMAALNQLWNSQDRNKFKYGIEISYFLPISCGPLERMLPLLNQLPLGDSLLWGIVKRLRTAFIDDHFNPPFGIAIQAYRSAKRLAASINITALQERMNNNEDHNFDENLEKLFELLQDILGLIYGSLCCILRASANEDQLSMTQVQVLNLHQYDLMITWLIGVCSIQDNIDETSSLLKGFALSIIQAYSDRMSDKDLQVYYQQVRKNMNNSNQQQILSLLFGANKQVLDLFDCEDIIMRITNYHIQISPRGSLVYYLFINKYLKMNQYLLSNRLFQDICEFVMRHLTLQEEQLSASQSDRHTSHHLVKISHLLIIGTQLVNYPWTELCNHSLPFIIKKIFYYLANSIFGLPQNAHENLYEAIMSIFSKKNQNINSIVFQNALEVYLSCFLKEREGDVGKMNLMCKVQQQILIILKESVNLTHVNDPTSRASLHLILNNPPQNDEIIQKEAIALMLKVTSLFNSQIIGMTLEEQNIAAKACFEIDFQKIADVFVDSLHLSKPLQDCFQTLQNGYDQIFCLRIKQLDADFSTSLLLLLEFSCIPVYHHFVDYVVLKMLQFSQKNYQILQKITNKARLKISDVKQAATKVTQMLQIVNILLESLYINPAWKSPKVVTAERMRIANHPQFRKCKENLDSLYTASLTEMMREVSLNEPKKETVYWSRRYAQILREQSPARHIIDQWFLHFKVM